jgi:hypothetical protein
MRYVKSYRRKDGTFVPGYYRGGGASGNWQPVDNKPQQGGCGQALFVLIFIALIYKACS